MITLTASEFIAKKNDDFNMNHEVGVKDIGRKGRYYYHREAWTFRIQSNLPKKVFVIERLRKESTEGELTYGNWKKGDIEYRIGYYIVGRIGKASGRWVWGQFCPLIPSNDLVALLDQAKKEGVIVES
ncbi:MAG: hypothetical protein UX08_C0004G0011 [Candidatus Collierbacteria bacterium GW2011_GWB1_45_35]|uniref:Uncharacterized protein n=2 Tax=Candidatus Collieribacteriota TaxID=1752725 RepID=A0A0G1MXX5_9BACT|nr:MAG: hypothetical protein UW48_C0002G0089 [Microgenomates group bacterium GW2011_GWC1_44_23]KKT85617.1 MAG: hypothetical protein UW84_C0026G0005 [Candidatus Collierbacteria bacterium GW2011_GWA2_44_99]KKT95653.1 MAG: hypothetical protein UW96_C0006G0084 [Candidatus Collierbacteria bacterium GW2011_GWA1_45_15]KKU00447.1 MAG: hypothetical protein UX01_C0004G0014 [Candidatus Collierbacteria bacterium GW2011_GWB2_45_17]KKU05548.1 MAG: hypothetical protein UX08_C0004G0011 [Candidatus Collierbacte